MFSATVGISVSSTLWYLEDTNIAYPSLYQDEGSSDLHKEYSLGEKTKHD
jgi:hypothetical protein